jgi:hypothetical protein
VNQQRRQFMRPRPGHLYEFPIAENVHILTLLFYRLRGPKLDQLL